MQVPSGGGGVSAAPAAGGGAAAAAAETKEEEKEEKVCTPIYPFFIRPDTHSLPVQEESDEDMGFGLFD